MTIAPGNARRNGSHLCRAMRDVVQTMGDTLPGKFEVTKEGIVHDMTSPGGPHEVTAAHVSRRLEKVMPDELLAHNGHARRGRRARGHHAAPGRDGDRLGRSRRRRLRRPPYGRRRHRDRLPVQPGERLGGQDARLPAARHPDLCDLRPPYRQRCRLHRHPLHPGGPRYAVRKNFVYGEDVTIGEWTISTSGLPRYQDDGAEEAES